MARATIPTGLSLDEWSTILGFSPWSFNQLFPVPSLTLKMCEEVWYQHSWQKGYLSREEIAQAISSAEDTLQPHLGYYASPRYDEGLVVQYPRSLQRYNMNREFTTRGMLTPIFVSGKIQCLGKQTRSVIEDDSTITYSDRSLDGIEDTFTISATTTITDPAEIAVYFSSTERMGEGIDETWRIRPVNVSIASGTVTITGHKTILTKPVLQEITKPKRLDPATVGNFPTTLDIQHLFYDSTDIGTAVWRGLSDEVPLTEIALNANSASIVDSQLGFVSIKVGKRGGRMPDFLRLNVSSGVQPDLKGKIPAPFNKMVAYLAVTYLGENACGCDSSDRLLHRWKNHPAMGDDRRPLTTSEIDNNPFGPSRGGQWAWQHVEMRANPINTRF